MNEIRVEPDIVFEIRDIVKHMHTLSYFYVCNIDNNEKKEIYMQELIEYKLLYEAKTGDMLKKYGLYNEKHNWSLDFDMGILFYD